VRKSLFLVLGLSLLLQIIISCIQTDTDSVDASTSLARINAAYLSKLSQCNQHLENIYLGGKDTTESAVSNCENSILATDCPFEEIPQFCMQLALFEVAVDVPEEFQTGTGSADGSSGGVF